MFPFRIQCCAQWALHAAAHGMQLIKAYSGDGFLLESSVAHNGHFMPQRMACSWFRPALVDIM
eukprot:1160413-Pelagomonas_calceolata.AAC.3